MNGYEKMLSLMRTQGALDNDKGIRLGEMQTAYTCKIGDLLLDRDDLQVDENLKGNLEAGDDVLVYQIEDSFYIIAKVVDL